MEEKEEGGHQDCSHDRIDKKQGTCDSCCHIMETDIERGGREGEETA